MNSLSKMDSHQIGQPVLSVVIPVYNAGKYIRHCLESLRNQTFAQWEAICVNDGSCDDSLSILEEYAEKDCRFKVFSQKNSGVSCARNVGLQYACGEWIAFLDADDWFEEDLLKKILCGDFHGRHYDAVVFASQDYGEVPVEGSHAGSKVVEYNTGDDFLLKGHNIPGVTTYCVWDKIFRRSLLNALNVRFHDKVRLGEDLLFAYQYLAQCGSVLVLASVNGYNHRIHPDSAFKNINFEMWKQQLVRFEVLYMLNLHLHKPGLGLYLSKDASSMVFLGKGSPDRARCIKLLVESSVFNRIVIRMILRTGSLKARLFVALYYLLHFGCFRTLLLENI